MEENSQNPTQPTTEVRIITKAVVTCPECNHNFDANMPTEGKQHFFKCPEETCNSDISTKENECCIFCSHSDQLCPAKQINPNEDENSDKNLQSLI